MRRFPHLINFEVVDKSEKLLGKCSLKTEEALSLQDFGQEFYLTLEGGKTALVRVRTLFKPSQGTIQRLRLNPGISVFTTAQQYLFFKVLKEGKLRDKYGYLIPSGDYKSMIPHNKETQRPNLINIATERISYLKKLLKDRQAINQQLNNISYKPGNDSHFQSFYRKVMETEVKQFEENNPYRPKIEENFHLFRHMWTYQAFAAKNKALLALQTEFWKQFQKDVMQSGDYEVQGLDSLEFRSVISRFAHTNDVMNRIYDRRSRVGKKIEENKVDS